MSNPVRDVFKDYKEENNIVDAKIENIDLFKKSKKLEIKLEVEEPIKIAEISSFEDYLKNRFQIQKVVIKIENVKKREQPLFTLQEDWLSIIEYISKSFPIAKAIFKSSSVEIEGNKVIIVLRTKSIDFLYSYKIDKEIEHIIYNLYGVKTKVECIENVTQDLILEQEKYLESLEKMVCSDIINEINVQNEIAKELEQKEKEAKEKAENGETKTDLIFGRTEKIKDQIVKITDLTTDYGRVSIEGKVISVDSRELKNGKTLVQFNIYDGTSTITCKSFVSQDKSAQVIRKIKRSKKN